MKNMIRILFALMLSAGSIHSALADDKVQRQYGIYWGADLKENTVYLNDFRYVFNASTRVHTEITNFGNMRSLNRGDNISFTVRKLNDGNFLITEVWVEPPEVSEKQ